MAAKKAKTKAQKAQKASKAPTTHGVTLDTLLGGKPASAFEPSKLEGKAHWRWNKGQLYEAFLLFDAAAQQARAVSKPTIARTSMNRAAITLFRSKRDPKEARRRLREVVDHYRAHPRDTEDRHFVDWAMSALIEDAADRAPTAAAFTKAYRAAVAEAIAVLGPDRFPRIHVERLADAARRAGADAIADELEG